MFAIPPMMPNPPPTRVCRVKSTEPPMHMNPDAELFLVILAVAYPPLFLQHESLAPGIPFHILAILSTASRHLYNRPVRRYVSSPSRDVKMRESRTSSRSRFAVVRWHLTTSARHDVGVHWLARADPSQITGANRWLQLFEGVVTFLHARSSTWLCMSASKCNRAANSEHLRPSLTISSCATCNSLYEHRLLMKPGLSERGAVQPGTNLKASG